MEEIVLSKLVEKHPISGKVSFSSKMHALLFNCTINLSSILSSVQFHFKMSVVPWLGDSTFRTDQGPGNECLRSNG